LLVFERAFALKAESGMRNELLRFAESQHESLRLYEVLDAGRLFSRRGLPQLNSPKQLNGLKNFSRVAKWGLQAPSGFTEIVSDDCPILHSSDRGQRSIYIGENLKYLIKPRSLENRAHGFVQTT
jgi:hypothetical protein